MQPADAWAGRRVCVAGAGVSGVAAAEALLRLGARVTVVDARDGAEERDRAAALEPLGARVRLGDAETLPEATELVVTSPGWRPTAPLFAAAAARGVPVWGEVELAWRLRPPGQPWLAVTGTNGKTTTVGMLAAVLTAAGRRAIAAGNVGTPLVTALAAEPPYDVLAVELSSFQLHWSPSVRPFAAAILNVAPDHLDWHGSAAAYAAAKARVFAPGTRAVVNADDPGSAALAPPGAVSVTLAPPGPGQLGVVDGVLVDRAYGADPGAGGQELARVADVRPAGPHNVANALAAAALARAHGVAPAAVGAGLRSFRPGGHRNAVVSVVDGVTYVDDSKATNPHAAAASLAGYDSVVWIAGGLNKGLPFDEVAAVAAPRLRAAVLLGSCRGEVASSLARHAPEVPVVEVASTDTGAMQVAVREAARLARPGDAVLLAPAAASMDMFRDYAARGDAFTAAVHRLAGPPAGGSGVGR
ncbi:MAG: UDP-N-acetylmuramoyl-L-alanine--D-glutamate ligase [Mycobacterium leprae]